MHSTYQRSIENAHKIRDFSLTAVRFVFQFWFSFSVRSFHLMLDIKLNYAHKHKLNRSGIFSSFSYKLRCTVRDVCRLNIIFSVNFGIFSEWNVNFTRLFHIKISINVNPTQIQENHFSHWIDVFRQTNKKKMLISQYVLLCIWYFSWQIETLNTLKNVMKTME